MDYLARTAQLRALHTYLKKALKEKYAGIAAAHIANAEIAGLSSGMRGIESSRGGASMPGVVPLPAMMSMPPMDSPVSSRYFAAPQRPQRQQQQQQPQQQQRQPFNISPHLTQTPIMQESGFSPVITSPSGPQGPFGGGSMVPFGGGGGSKVPFGGGGGSVVPFGGGGGGSVFQHASSMGPFGGGGPMIRHAPSTPQRMLPSLGPFGGGGSPTPQRMLPPSGPAGWFGMRPSAPDQQQQKAWYRQQMQALFRSAEDHRLAPAELQRMGHAIQARFPGNSRVQQRVAEAVAKHRLLIEGRFQKTQQRSLSPVVGCKRLGVKAPPGVLCDVATKRPLPMDKQPSQLQRLFAAPRQLKQKQQRLADPRNARYVADIKSIFNAARARSPNFASKLRALQAKYGANAKSAERLREAQVLFARAPALKPKADKRVVTAMQQQQRVAKERAREMQVQEQRMRQKAGAGATRTREIQRERQVVLRRQDQLKRQRTQEIQHERQVGQQQQLKRQRSQEIQHERQVEQKQQQQRRTVRVKRK